MGANESRDMHGSLKSEDEDVNENDNGSLKSEYEDEDDDSLKSEYEDEDDDSLKSEYEDEDEDEDVNDNDQSPVTDDMSDKVNTDDMRDNVNTERSFPTGVIIEVVSRLPIKTLAQCQSVCKEWRALIQERYLTEMHLDRSTIVYHWHNTLPSNNPQYTPNPDPFVYRHGCNGLLLMMNINAKKHYVWNPAIHRALELPDPHDSSQGFAFSYVPATKSYRIVSFYTDGDSLGCEVLTPGDKHGNVWRALESPEIANSTSKKGAIKRVSVVSCGGATHYVRVTEVGECTDIDIVSLELETERFTVSRFPDLPVGWKNYWDLDWDGKLGFADIVGGNLEVMELEDYKSGRWCEKKRVVPLDFSNKSNAVPLLVDKGEIWFWLKDEKIFKYAIETGRCTYVVKERALSLSSKTLPYKPSLVSVEGMVPDTMLERLRPDITRAY